MTRRRRGPIAALAGALLATVAAVAAGCGGTAGEPSPSGSATTGAGPSAYASPLAPATELPPPPNGDDGPGTSTSAPPSPNARSTAEAFARAWARPNLRADAWLAGVQPLAAPGYARLLATVDPANIPARTVTGPTSVISATTAVNVFAVPTDAGILQVTCGLHGDKWLVTTVDLRRQPP